MRVGGEEAEDEPESNREPGADEAKTVKRDDEPPLLPGLAELLGANERGDLHEIRPGMILHAKWELLEPLGEGSFGRVYEARHVKLGHRAAIKVLMRQTPGRGARQRFLEEAQLMAGLSSEHLIRASDYDELEDGTPYFVMDLVKGKSLRHWLKERLPLWRVAEIGEQILAGLVEVHRLGVVHGDIKPENVVIGEDDDKACLLDFGLAQTSAEESAGLGGTPCYMAPEMLVDGGPATVRTDVYAAGVVLYEMLTGRLPRGHLRMDTAKLRREWKVRRRADPVLMHCKQVPEAHREALEMLDKLVMEALASEPTQRPKSALPMLEELGRLRRKMSSDAVAPTLTADGERAPRDPEVRTTTPLKVVGPVERERPAMLRWAVAAVVVGLAGVVGWWAFPSSAGPEAPGTEPTEIDDSFSEKDAEGARKGILVAVPTNASQPAMTGFEALCTALGGARAPVEGALPVVCRRVPPMGLDALVTLAEDAGVRVVVMVGSGDSVGIVVRSTSHHRGNALLARLDGLELPTAPEAMAAVAPVLRAVVGARAAAGATGAAEAEIPAVEWEHVGARWGVLTHWLRVQQGHNTPADLRQRRALAQVLEDELLEERGRGADEGAAFFRDLAVLVSATSLSCAGSERMLSELSEAREHRSGIRVAALLERVSCLLERNDAKSRVDEAEQMLAEAFLASGGDECVRVAAIGSVSWIDALKKSDAGWAAHRKHLPGMQRCEPGMWSRKYAVRGDSRVVRGDWCGAAEAYGLAYEASVSNLNALVAWPEYASKCSERIDEWRRTLLDELQEALDSGRFTAAGPRVSLAYMRWWLSRDPAHAETVLVEHAKVNDGELGMIEGTASDLETEICEGAEGDSCSLRILARPKRAGDAERLRRSLGL